MMPAARLQAAIELLDDVLAGTPAEQALTGWARRSRFAGSKDRAAVRDHVFDALRCQRSYAARGGAMTGRGLILGALRSDGTDPATLFTGAGYGPQPLSAEEVNAGHDPHPGAETGDLPDWLWPIVTRSLGPDAEVAAGALRRRAAVHLRVNLRESDRESAIRTLATQGITCQPHDASAMALEVTEGSRRIRNSDAYLNGLVELQDAASQAVADALPLTAGMRVLDYCAGGGGKALAIVARADVTVFAHDVAPGRMRDLPDRAARAGAQIVQLDTGDLADAAPFDLVLCDAPCSGSGAWRRAPEGKWRLTPDRLDALCTMQAEILDSAAALTTTDGVLAYATCSILDVENEHQIAGFLSTHPDWQETFSQHWHVQHGTDGFFTAHLTRASDGR